MNKFYLLLIFLFLIPLISANNDYSVWQGQYYVNNEFQANGEHTFIFNVYDDEFLGNSCYINTTTLTTGNWGEWSTNQQGVNTACGNYSKDYFLEITIDGDIQTPRRRLLFPNYVLKNSSAILWNVTANNICYANGTNCNTTNISYVPYTGATTDVNLGNRGLTTTGCVDTGRLVTDDLRINTIRGNSLTLISDDLQETPTATPLSLKCLAEEKVKIYPDNADGQTIWSLRDSTYFIGDTMIFANNNETAYWVMEYVDGYSYMAYGVNGLQWHTNDGAILVLDAYPDGTTEWHENGKYDKNLNVIGNIINSNICYANGTNCNTTNISYITNNSNVVLNNGNFTGNLTGNQIYAEAWYSNDTGQTISYATTYQSLSMTNSTLNGFNISGLALEQNTTLIPQISGLYLANYFISGSGLNNHEYYLAPFVNSNEQIQCKSRFKLNGTLDSLDMAGTCFIRVSAGENITLQIKDITETGNGLYKGSNLNLVRIGS